MGVEQCMYLMRNVEADVVLFADYDVAAHSSTFGGVEEWQQGIHVGQVWSKRNKSARLDCSIEAEPGCQSAAHRKAAHHDTLRVDGVILFKRGKVLLDFILRLLVVVADKGIGSRDLRRLQNGHQPALRNNA